MPADWRRLIRAAGLTEGDVAITWHMPFRLCVARRLSGPVIIGGGPAGAAAAIMLARAGRAVTLIERSAEPADKVCGDFLSAEAIEMHRAPGRRSVARCVDDHRGRAWCTGTAWPRRALPFAARGLSRRALDEALLRQATSDGAAVLRGHRVARDRATGRRIDCGCDCGSLGTIVADTVFLATGKHELRGAARTGAATPAWSG